MRAVQGASGTTGCRPNVLAGAFYWATLMTTGCYGNSIVTSHVTRWLSYTFGFFSILVFLSVVTHSAKVLVSVVDDFVIENNLQRLVKGFTSCVCWLIILCSMIVLNGYLILTVLAKRTSTDFAQYYLPLSEYIWFRYISAITVVFGDYNPSITGARLESIILIVFVLLCGNLFIAAVTLRFHTQSSYLHS